MFLFPSLCAAVAVRDVRLRECVQRLLLLTGHALALVPSLPGQHALATGADMAPVVMPPELALDF
jgi:hypothetical protein